MTNYDSLDNKGKRTLKNQLVKYSKLFGGKNHLLSLIEAIRMAHPNPLMAKDACFRFAKGSIKWEKVIFKEKVNLLIGLIRNNENNNLIRRRNMKYFMMAALLVACWDKDTSEEVEVAVEEDSAVEAE